MSSTNRGYERHKTDYYITPENAVRDGLSAFLDHENISRPDMMNWLDPCAGGDAEHGMAYADVISEEFGADVDTIDIREDSRAEIKGNYLTQDLCMNKYDVIISNPPFYSAQEFIKKALSDVSENGYVVMLLRLNFFGSKSRFSFFTKTPPKWAFVHHGRLSFTEDGKTDSVEYMTCVWQKGCEEITKLIVI